jgi:3-hydroxyacyl-CoA dehydrogenase/enoyl-CoA hydratase/3-hydroxybutyryl-CoA epimerase
MGTPMPDMSQFRTEIGDNGVLHLIFDVPGRSMNVFTNKAIHEILTFADWLPRSEVRGVVVRSGKMTAFCAGADLGELGVAYDMIMAAPRERRKQVAHDHFAPIGRAFRKLETSGIPVAAAINGLALGGGCELAMGCHYRVLADTPQTALGLPESLVGLLPGAGGTQRMPRLVGLEKALPILLHGARLSAADAVAFGAANEVVPPGEEVAAAERWVLDVRDPKQPWDRAGWQNPAQAHASRTVAAARAQVLAETGGHVPAPLAILDCIERGLPQQMDKAIREEIDIFADLIKRPEPRNMIQTLFLGRQDYDKRRKAGTLPEFVAAVVADVSEILAGADEAQKQQAGIAAGPPLTSPSADWNRRDGIWYEAPETSAERHAADLIHQIADAARRHADGLNEDDRRLVDYATVKELGFPGYAGGPFALLARLD